MSLILQDKTSIISVLAVRLEFYKFRDFVDDTPSTAVVRMTDSSYPIGIIVNSVLEEFVPMGSLLSLTATKNELAATQSQLSISLSGLPETTMWKMLNNPIKNTRVNIYRVFYDTETKSVINTNPFGRFTGTVSYFTVEDSPGTPGSCSITLVCNNKTTDLSKVVGRNNGPISMQFYFPNDTSYDRIINLVGTRYNFGSPKSTAPSGLANNTTGVLK